MRRALGLIALVLSTTVATPQAFASSIEEIMGTPLTVAELMAAHGDPNPNRFEPRIKMWPPEPYFLVEVDSSTATKDDVDGERRRGP